MKKIMFGLAAAIAMVAAADIESSNTVGYTSKAVEAGKFYLVGVQFNEVGATGGAVALDKLITLSPSIAPGL